MLRVLVSDYYIVTIDYFEEDTSIQFQAFGLVQIWGSAVYFCSIHSWQVHQIREAFQLRWYERCGNYNLETIKRWIMFNLTIDTGQPWSIEFQTRRNVLTHERKV